MLCIVILDISNLIIKLSQGYTPICEMVHWDYRPRYYLNLKDNFAKNYLFLKIKIVGVDMKRGGYPLKIF